ncbi:hypothetical protein [Streptomyces sp. NPDC021212]|uniref:hypothetical protein n=1 Tax=Streptomyces sp. NPDC021212 TaxID=3365118 RepID=UPI0037AC9511
MTRKQQERSVITCQNILRAAAEVSDEARYSGARISKIQDQRLIDLTFRFAKELQNNVLFRAGVRLAVEQGELDINKDDTAYQEWVEQFHTLWRYLLPSLATEEARTRQSAPSGAAA